LRELALVDSRQSARGTQLSSGDHVSPRG
jgi:hypothetical protein